MDSILIEGGIPLIGKINISGAKNATLPIMASTILTNNKITITNVPKLADVYTMKCLLENHGAIITENKKPEESELSIDCSCINNNTAPYDIVRKMRASIWVMAPLIAKTGFAKVSLPGGCAIGTRQIDLHLSLLQAMGVNIKVKHGYIYAKLMSKRLQAVHFCFSKVSVGATITGILASVLAEGETVLSNCAMEPEIVDLCKFLNAIGCNIHNIGNNTLTIIGVKILQSTNYSIIPDRIEAGSYMIAGAITKGDITICGINSNIIENTALALKQAGLEVTQANNYTRVKYIGSIHPVDIQTAPYPGFATDLQAQFMSLMTIADGLSTITENIFDNRFMHVNELCRMGANIKIKDHVAIVQGVDSLSAAEVIASDLRASISLILAGLIATGQTKVKRIYHLDRGYQLLEQKLKQCGANIKRIKGDNA